MLDIGCGAGILLSEAGSTSRFGVDVKFDALRTAVSIDPEAKWVCASIYALPFLDRSFDVVVAADVVPGADYAAPSDDVAAWRQAMLSEARRVLRDQGTLLLTTPNRGHWAYYNVAKLSQGELQDLLAPYFVGKIRGYNPLPPFPFLLAPRLMAWVPRRAWRYLFVPSGLLAHIPFIEPLLRLLMKVPQLSTVSKAFFVEAFPRYPLSLSEKGEG